jgi:anti-sigma factor RsiW
MFSKRRSQHPADDDLSAYLDGELGDDQARAVSAHLDGCAACRGALDGLRTAKSTLARLPRVQPSRSFTLSPAAARTSPPPPRPRVLSFVPAMALSVLVILLAVDFAGGGDESPSAGGLALERAGKASDQALQPQASQDAAGSTRQAPPQPTPAAGAFAAPAPPAPAVPQRDTAAENLSQSPAGGAASETAIGDADAAGDNGGDDEAWLHRFEALAAVALVLSLVVAFGPRLWDRIMNREDRS